MEAEAAVESDAGVVFAGDAGDEGACVGGAAFGDKTFHECTAYAATLRPVGEVYGGLQGAPVGGTLFPRVGVAVAVDRAVGLVDEVGVGGGNLLHAAGHFCYGHRLGLKRDGGVDDVVVIYVGQSGDVAWLYGSYHRCGIFVLNYKKRCDFCCIWDNTLNLPIMEDGIELRTAAVTRYITPLREGGSLPALAEADDGFKYVVKFRGAGHGTKALIAELIGGELARAAGLRVPEQVFLDLDEDFGRTEGDEEIQDLLQSSRGLNLGLHYLSGAMTWDVAVNATDAVTASRIVWLDAFLTNIDRTPRNTNMLLWQGDLWLIDHGTSLYFHHSWQGWERAALSPFPYVKDHALLPRASRLLEADDYMRSRITPEVIDAVVAAVPDDWLTAAAPDIPAVEQRRVYSTFLKERLANSRIFVDHAISVRKSLV